MTGVFPERLVTVRGYASPDLATEDHRKLTDAGLDAAIAGASFEPGRYSYNSPGQEPVQLRVPESQAEAASKILEQDEDDTSANEIVQPGIPSCFARSAIPATLIPFRPTFSWWAVPLQPV